MGSKKRHSMFLPPNRSIFFRKKGWLPKMCRLLRKVFFWVCLNYFSKPPSTNGIHQKRGRRRHSRLLPWSHGVNSCCVTRKSCKIVISESTLGIVLLFYPFLVLSCCSIPGVLHFFSTRLQKGHFYSWRRRANNPTTATITEPITISPCWGDTAENMADVNFTKKNALTGGSNYVVSNLFCKNKLTDLKAKSV